MPVNPSRSDRSIFIRLWQWIGWLFTWMQEKSIKDRGPMSISATSVKTLRDRTNQPMMDCKAALTEATGDMEKAVEILRKKSKDVVDKKVGRETAEGRIAIFTDLAKKVGAILEMRCESPPVTKSDAFVTLADDLARQVALQNATSVDVLLKQPFVDDAKK